MPVGIADKAAALKGQGHGGGGVRCGIEGRDGGTTGTLPTGAGELSF